MSLGWVTNSHKWLSIPAKANKLWDSVSKHTDLIPSVKIVRIWYTKQNKIKTNKQKWKMQMNDHADIMHYTPNDFVLNSRCLGHWPKHDVSWYRLSWLNAVCGLVECTELSINWRHHDSGHDSMGVKPESLILWKTQLELIEVKYWVFCVIQYTPVIKDRVFKMAKSFVMRIFAAFNLLILIAAAVLGMVVAILVAQSKVRLL